MNDVKHWEAKWQDWIDSVSQKLRESHQMIQQPHPFDTWIHWSRGVPLRRQGWKLHLSPHPEILGETLRLIADLSENFLFDFKVIGSYKLFVRLNAGHLGESQVGKTITIYPENDEMALDLYEALRSFAQYHQGPFCPSDLYFSVNDRVSFRWGQIGEAHTTYDRLGKPKHWIESPQGNWVDDERRIPGKLPTGVSSLSWQGQSLSPLPVDVPAMINWDTKKFVVKHNYGRTLKQVLLMEEENTKELFILKRTWKGLGLTNEGRTYQQEALNEFRITQSLSTNEQKPCAAVLALRETAFFFESLMEDAGSDSLEKVPVSATQKHWPRILETIEVLHNAGIVHRDLKRRNIILNSQSDKNITLIDFELAGKIGSPLPCSSGTNGYKAPESEKGAKFSPAMDLYALGSLLFEIAMGRDPSMYLISEEQRIQLLRLNGFNNLADVVKKFYEQPELRPSLPELRNLTTSPDVFQLSSPVFDLVNDFEVKEAISEAMASLKVFERWGSTDELHWANQHLLSTVNHRGINIGSSGVLIALTQIKILASNPAELKLRFDTDRLDLLIRATAHGLLRGTPYGEAHGFMTGNAGTAYALSIAGLQLNEPEWIEHALQLWINATSEKTEPDFFSGVAGILFVGLQLINSCNRIELKSIAAELVQYLVDEVVDYEGLWAWPPSADFGGLPTLGASHGAAGIAMVLSQWAALVDDQDLMSFATEVFQRIFRFGRSSNGNSLRYDIHPQSQPRAATDWCHGAGSYLWAMLNSSCSQEALTEEIEWAKKLFLKSPISSNPTYCHGLAGQLELSMMLGDTERAERIKRAMMLQRRSFAKKATWPSENPEQFSPDLWVGFLGPTVALARAQIGHETALFSI